MSNQAESSDSPNLWSFPKDYKIVSHAGILYSGSEHCKSGNSSPGVFMLFENEDSALDYWESLELYGPEYVLHPSTHVAHQKYVKGVVKEYHYLFYHEDVAIRHVHEKKNETGHKFDGICIAREDFHVYLYDLSAGGPDATYFNILKLNGFINLIEEERNVFRADASLEG